MSGFSAEWLALREPYDTRARNPDILGAVAAAVARLPSVTIVDLACGTGSTLRAVGPRLQARQHWRLVDNDLSLLARAADATPPPGANVTAVPVDLARDLEAVLAGPVDLVTASALLDLVSDAWLERLAVETAARRAPLYAALTYDGRIAWDPPDRGDAGIAAAVNRHQRGDKGFGPALGPEAARRAVERFEAVGYGVVHGPSDWVFGPRDAAIQAEIAAGWAAAAQETGDIPPGAASEWLARRLAVIEAGRSSLRVGHIDFLARP